MKTVHEARAELARYERQVEQLRATAREAVDELERASVELGGIRARVAMLERLAAAATASKAG